MRSRLLPLDLSIPEPCQESWEAMRDSGVARRHCERCQSAVVDVALLTAPELRGLLERTGGVFCARLTRLPDGRLLLREARASVVPAAGLLRAPVLVGAVLAGSALSVPAQDRTHANPPLLSCAEVTMLQQPTLPQASPVLPARAAAPSPAPAPPAEGQARSVTLGKMATRLVPLHGTVRLPGGRTVRRGLVYAPDAHGSSTAFAVNADGSYAAALPPGKYLLRADVRTDDAEFYAAVDEVVLAGAAVTRDLTLQGPVTVTAGAPALAPQPNSRKP